MGDDDSMVMKTMLMMMVMMMMTMMTMMRMAMMKNKEWSNSMVNHSQPDCPSPFV